MIPKGMNLTKASQNMTTTTTTEVTNMIMDTPTGKIMVMIIMNMNMSVGIMTVMVTMITMTLKWPESTLPVSTRRSVSPIYYSLICFLIAIFLAHHPQTPHECRILEATKDL